MAAITTDPSAASISTHAAAITKTNALMAALRSARFPGPAAAATRQACISVIAANSV